MRVFALYLVEIERREIEITTKDRTFDQNDLIKRHISTYAKYTPFCVCAAELCIVHICPTLTIALHKQSDA